MVELPRWTHSSTLTHGILGKISRYSKTIHTQLCDVPQPSISESEVLIQVKAAAVNPLELLILTGSVKLMNGEHGPQKQGHLVFHIHQ